VPFFLPLFIIRLTSAEPDSLPREKSFSDQRSERCISSFMRQLRKLCITHGHSAGRFGAAGTVGDPEWARETLIAM